MNSNKTRDHYLEAPEEINTKDIRQLPNREDLSKLYPSHSPRKNTETKSIAGIDSGIKKFALITGVAIPIPFIAAMYFIDLATVHITTSSIFYFLPIIVIGLFTWVTIIALLYKKIDARFYYYGRGLIPFLLGYTFCISLTAPLLYTIAKGNTLLFAAVLLTNSIILSTSFIALPDNKFKKTVVNGITLLSIVALGVYLVIFHT